jgi:hypothetical protein
MLKTLMKRLLPFSACNIVALTLLALGWSDGLISPRELTIALLAWGVAVGIWAVLIIRKSAKESKTPVAPPPTPIDAMVRERRLLGIRVGKAAIVALVLLLILGVLRGGPWLSLLVGAVVNISAILVIMRVVQRLQRSLFE